MNIRSLILCFLAALFAGGLAYLAASKMPVKDGRGPVLLDNMNELAWLRTELNLTPSQVEAVANLHHAYRPRCAEMCARIHDAEAHLAALASAGSAVTPELTRAIQDAARVRAECQQAMLGHLYQTAALLDPDQAHRYLRAMVPMALGTPSPDSTHAGH